LPRAKPGFLDGLRWSGITNGELLRRAAARFDVFVTGDQSIQYQQNLSTLGFGLVIVAGRNNRVETICSMAPQITAAISAVRRGQVQVVAA
jgi:hypothetical protein